MVEISNYWHFVTLWMGKEQRAENSIIFTLKNTSNEVNANESKFNNKYSKSLLLKNNGVFIKTKYKGIFATIPISDPLYININDNNIAHIRFGYFSLII